MTCGDVYTLAAPLGCGNVWAFPSQVHPSNPNSGGGGVRPGLRPYIHHEEKRRRHLDTEEDILAVLGLL
jgi:hypothetical protein